MRDGSITQEGIKVLEDLEEEFKVLQFSERIDEIVISSCRGISDYIRLVEPVRDDLLGLFTDTIFIVQKSARTEQRKKDNRLCLEKCQSGPATYNFTSVSLPVELQKFLEHGLNNVPDTAIDEDIVATEVDKDIRTSCRNLFRTATGYYPRNGSIKESLDSFLKNLMIMAPGNSELVSSLVCMRENFIAKRALLQNHRTDSSGQSIRFIQNLIPIGCILSPSDKNLGISLLPPRWYEKEYAAQEIKGGYELQQISETQCVNLLLNKIDSFRLSLTEEQRLILKPHWPRGPVQVPRIGVLKLVPKVHKLVGPIGADTWKDLKSRPIRGAENDPMKVPSRALYHLLQDMLRDFRAIFPTVNASTQFNNFTVLAGCDDYTARLNNLNLDSDLYSRTFLVSADFSDAFTETQVPRLQESISVTGHLLGYEKSKIDLMRTLVELVFSNCYFCTPFGLFRQTRGMPMGDYSSRDSLDLDLTRSEYEIITLVMDLPLKIHLYVRLVDDISIIAQGEFSDLIILLNIISERYPSMPLNLQISFAYSRFLDLHIYNMKPEEGLGYGLSTTLAYKEHSTFSYTPWSSNIHDGYKTSVVPISLYRAHARCTEPKDVNHHVDFMKNIIKARNQDPKSVVRKYKSFFKKRHGGKPVSKEKGKVQTTPILFDRVSGQHEFVRDLIKTSFCGQVKVVYKSRSKISSLLCPKRKIIKKLSELLK